MNNNKNYEHRTTNNTINTDIHKLTQIYTRQHRYTQVENIIIQVSKPCVKQLNKHSTNTNTEQDPSPYT
jgi:hypothetical protein